MGWEYLLAGFGALMALLSIIIAVNPAGFSRGIVAFSRWRYFHVFEVTSRLVFGVLFIVLADRTLYPGLMRVIGYVLVAVSVGLVILAPARHRAFALWSAKTFQRAFRPAGVAGIIFGSFLVYAAIG